MLDYYKNSRDSKSVVYKSRDSTNNYVSSARKPVSRRGASSMRGLGRSMFKALTKDFHFDSDSSDEASTNIYCFPAKVEGEC